MKKVSFKTLGCRLNQYETDALVTQFHQAGYQVVDYSEKADITVINTCTVTNQSDQKSRHSINQAARKNPQGLLVVAGCMVNNHREALEQNERITYVVDNERKSHIVNLVDAHFKGEIIHPESYGEDRFGFEAVDKSLHTRTSIKVQDGCDNFCTYCIVPSVRGRAVSRPQEMVLENIRQVVDNGFKEVVITGVNIGRYEYQGMNLQGLLEKVLELPGDFRVRISSLEPDGFGPEFHHLFHHPKMMPHLHLCIQSGSDLILKKMRRMYTVAQFRKIVEAFRKAIPAFNFTTDIIVGFPGETDAHFRESLDVVREMKFSHVHTFRYSRRKGTRADRLEDQVPEPLKAERSEQVRRVSEENRIAFMETLMGKEQRVLVEKIDGNKTARGYGELFLPVHFPAGQISRNQFAGVKIEGVKKTSEPCLLGRIIP